MKGLVIGRIVHYVTAGYGERAAIIVDIWNEEKAVVNLQVFGNTGNTGDLFGEKNLRWEFNVPYNEELTAHSWHWIE